MDKACKKGFELLGDFNCTTIDCEGGVKLGKGYFFLKHGGVFYMQYARE